MAAWLCSVSPAVGRLCVGQGSERLTNLMDQFLSF
jgi:hypothetical protein